MLNKNTLNLEAFYESRRSYRRMLLKGQAIIHADGGTTTIETKVFDRAFFDSTALLRASRLLLASETPSGVKSQVEPMNHSQEANTKLSLTSSNSCPICQMGSIYLPLAMRRHLLYTHPGHICLYCLRLFRRPSCLPSHLNAVHRHLLRRYRCPRSCGRRFAGLISLHHHISCDPLCTPLSLNILGAAHHNIRFTRCRAALPISEAGLDISNNSCGYSSSSSSSSSLSSSSSSTSPRSGKTTSADIRDKTLCLQNQHSYKISNTHKRRQIRGLANSDEERSISSFRSQSNDLANSSICLDGEVEGESNKHLGNLSEQDRYSTKDSILLGTF
ncbi:unnamed protein product [Protopolystoma xenopodis]|uniref:C2H2-type domain-containing protein n=1 Tax=Protopolystoma xenopodis TaxID=117903 RepID=A0A3S5CSA6_9PLAT|nr:unnamed protein product [Protopolystoma xenopodis]